VYAQLRTEGLLVKRQPTNLHHDYMKSSAQGSQKESSAQEKAWPNAILIYVTNDAVTKSNTKIRPPLDALSSLACWCSHPLPLPDAAATGMEFAAMGSRSAVAHLFAVASLVVLLAHGGEAVGFWLPPPESSNGHLGGAADRYLTRGERWMSQTLDHFNPTVKYLTVPPLFAFYVFKLEFSSF
jgi:hypothetical protein